MVAKLAVLIVALGACACGLLMMRHQRAQAAHELATARLRIVETEARLWRLRSEIAQRVTPEEVARLSSSLGPLQPLTPEALRDAPVLVAAPPAAGQPDEDEGGDR